MRLLAAACGCVLGVGALFGALALSEHRDLSKPIQVRVFPLVCEQYVTAFEACGADALKVSARLAASGHVGVGSAPYIQRQLNQLRRELADVRASGGDPALFAYCQMPQFEDVNYRLVRQMAAPLLELNVMSSACASAVGRVIQSHGDPTSTHLEVQNALEVSSAVASISAVPTNSSRR